MRAKGFEDNFRGVQFMQLDDIIYRDIKTEREKPLLENRAQDQDWILDLLSWRNL